MSSFKDKSGREWEIPPLDALVIKKVREVDEKFLIGEVQKTFDRLSADPALLCNTIFILCRKQREERKTTEEEFYLQVIGSGEAIEEAEETLRKSILDFIPPRNRKLLEVSAEKNKKLRELNQIAAERDREVANEALEKMRERIEDPALKAEELAAIKEGIERTIKQTLTRLSNASSSPDSSAANQKEEHSGI